MSMHKQSCSILTVFLLTAVVTAEITLSPKITPQLLSETSTGRNRKVWIHFTNNKIENLHELRKFDWQKPHQPNLTGTKKGYHPKQNNNAVKKKYNTWKS